MMTVEDIKLLAGGPVRDAVAANIGRDPLQVALDKHIAHAALVASQVKYLQRAKTKLPSYYAARCILPPIAFEQSSSEPAAAHKDYSGGLCVDLTCGLGVDAFYLSKHFDRVVTLERDPVVAEAARINFNLLGAGNIEVVNMPAEEYFAGNAVKADLIYADPDRRDAGGRKMVLLQDCSPDIISLMPSLKQAAPKIVLKLSPMFDVDEVFRIFGTHTNVDVVSLDGECKEVLVELDDSISGPAISATAIGGGSVTCGYGGNDGAIPAGPGLLPEYRYLIVPDAALVKARLAARYFRGAGAYIENDNSFAFTNELPENIFGKAYYIESHTEYSPKKLKKDLRLSGVGRLNILKKDFPHSAPEIARQLSVGEGGRHFAAFTRHGGALKALFLKPV